VRAAVCLAGNDILARQPQLDIHDVADRMRVFRDPKLQPAAHARLREMFEQVGIALQVTCSANTPADIQWLVKANHGLALIDQASPLDPELTTRVRPPA
jgi:hypothetical protein